MRFFIDTADVAEIRDLAETGLVDGVTTNPSLVAKTGRDFTEILKEICAIVPGPVSAEVTALECEAMLAEGRSLATLADNVTIKVPLTPDGLKACKQLSDDGIKVNVTLCFSAAQALLAAKAGAAFVSPFVGRLDDIGHDGMAVVRDIVEIFDRYHIPTQVLAASLRHPLHVVRAAQVGAHISTMPYSVFRSMFKHPLTDVGMQKFLEDARRAEKVGT